MSLPGDLADDMQWTLSSRHDREIEATDARIAAARDTVEEMAGLSGPNAEDLADARTAADEAEAAVRWWSPGSKRRARSAREAVAAAQAELDSCVQKRDRAAAELAAAQRRRDEQTAEHIADRAAFDAYVRGRAPADADQAGRMDRMRQLHAAEEERQVAAELDDEMEEQGLAVQRLNDRIENGELTTEQVYDRGVVRGDVFDAELDRRSPVAAPDEPEL